MTTPLTPLPLLAAQPFAASVHLVEEGAPAQQAKRDEGEVKEGVRAVLGAPTPAQQPGSGALIIYTSGTTGRPKGEFRGVVGCVCGGGGVPAGGEVVALGGGGVGRASYLLPLPSTLPTPARQAPCTRTPACRRRCARCARRGSGVQTIASCTRCLCTTSTVSSTRSSARSTGGGYLCMGVCACFRACAGKQRGGGAARAPPKHARAVLTPLAPDTCACAAARAWR